MGSLSPQALSAARKSILVEELLAQASRLLTLRSLMSDETLSLEHLGTMLQVCWLVGRGGRQGGRQGGNVGLGVPRA